MNTAMLRVAGLTVSLSATRLAIITRRTSGVCVANTTTITGHGKQASDLADRHSRIIELRHEILYAAALTELVVIEDPGRGTRGSSQLAHHGLWWAVVGKLVDLGVPVAVCPPVGARPGVAAVAGEAITPLWPDTRLSAPAEGTALALAHAGAVRLGWNVPVVPEACWEMLDAIAWPDAVSKPRTGAASGHADPAAG